MAKRFEDLAARTKAGWSEDTRRVYDAASSVFTAELAAQAALGELLTVARESQQLSQYAVQDRAGVQQAEISRIERGLSNPTVGTLLRLADALGQQLTLVPAQPSPPREQDSPGHSVLARSAGNGIPSEQTRTNLAAVRAWANANGYTVAPRGRIAGTVIEAYQQQTR